MTAISIKTIIGTATPIATTVSLGCLDEDEEVAEGEGDGVTGVALLVVEEELDEVGVAVDETEVALDETDGEVDVEEVLDEGVVDDELESVEEDSVLAATRERVLVLIETTTTWLVALSEIVGAKSGVSEAGAESAAVTVVEIVLCTSIKEVEYRVVVSSSLLLLYV